MKPIVIIGGTFLLWILLIKNETGTGHRFDDYAALVHKNPATASNSPTSFDASAAPSGGLTLEGAAASGAALLAKGLG